MIGQGSGTFAWGILGAARIARTLIPAIRAAGGEVTVLGVREPGSGRAQAFAREWAIGRVGTYDDVLASDVRALYAPLPNDAHHPWSRAAMQAGKHVLTEKPLCLNAGEAQVLADETRRRERGGCCWRPLPTAFSPTWHGCGTS